jgi:hypothetical protein
MASREPPANTSPEAVALRTLAQKFGKAPVRDANDTDGQGANRALLKAAIAYARVADPLYARAGVVLSEMDRGIVDGSLLDDDLLGYLDEKVRPLTCELLGHKKRCESTDRCLERQEDAGLV